MSDDHAAHEPCAVPFCRLLKPSHKPFCARCWALLDTENRERVFVTWLAVIRSETWEIACTLAEHEDAIKRAMRYAASVREHMRLLRCDAEHAREAVRAGKELARLLAEEM